MIFVDTPGLHSPARAAHEPPHEPRGAHSLQDADVNLFVVEALRWTDEDQRVLDELIAAVRPILLVLNKVDKVIPARAPAAVHRGAGTAARTSRKSCRCRRSSAATWRTCRAIIARYLPQSPPHFPTDQVTDRSDEFQAAEIVREKLTLRLHQELPYGLTVGLEQFKEEEGGCWSTR